MTIRPASAHDVPQLARTATRAFVDDPVMRWFFPDLADYERNQPELVVYMTRRWSATQTLWCTDDGVALAGWVPPGRPDVEVEAPAIEHPAWRLERFAGIGAALAEHTPSELHWYLNLLATHPDWQRRGLGAALMGVVFERADAVGLPCYLETETVENVAYYRHHGFDVRSEWDCAPDGPHMWGMLRPPSN